MKIARIALVALACGAGALAGRAQIGIGINIGVPGGVIGVRPPPENYEAVPRPPGPGYVWIRGHWRRHREHWVWESGYWAFPPYPGAVWLPGQWVAQNGAWVWVDGRFQGPPPAQPPVVAPPPGPPAPPQVVTEAPPAVIPEAIPPVSPGPEFFWIGGHWMWQRGWVWVGGHFERHPHFHPGAAWIAGHWDRRGGGYVWVEGAWR